MGLINLKRENELIYSYCRERKREFMGSLMQYRMRCIKGNTIHQYPSLSRSHFNLDRKDHILKSGF